MLQRLMVVVMLAGVFAAPLPLYATAACAPEACCAAAAETAFDLADCCAPVVCASPEQAPPSAVPPAPQIPAPSAGASLLDVTVVADSRLSEELRPTDSPPPMRVRLAHLSTLLI